MILTGFLCTRSISAIRDNEVLITSDINVACVAVWMPQEMVFKFCHKFSLEVPHPNSLHSEGQKELTLVKENEGCRGHEVSFANIQNPVCADLIKKHREKKIQPKEKEKNMGSEGHKENLELENHHCCLLHREFEGFLALV